MFARNSYIQIMMVVAALLLIPGCTDDCVCPESELGLVMINPSPDTLDAPWLLEGPGEYSYSGSGDRVLSSLSPGEYTLTWGAVGEWTPPMAASQALAAGGAITFNGIYQNGRIRGRVTDYDGVGIADALILINYDNPFGQRPLIAFGFANPVAQEVRFWVADPCDGSEIIELMHGMLPVGQYSLFWDALDSEGIQVTEGMYLGILEAETGGQETEVFLFMGPYDEHDSTEGLLGFAVTDANGYYGVAQECLDFGIEIDFFGSPYFISRNVRIWAVQDGYSAAGGDWTNVSLTNGAEVDLSITQR